MQEINKDSQINENPTEEKCLDTKNIDDIYIVHKIYLGVLLRTFSFDNHFLIDLASNSHKTLAPTNEYSQSIIRILKVNNIITPYIALENDSEKLKNKCLSGQIYNICIHDSNVSKKELLSNLMFPNKASSDLKDGDILIHFLIEIQYYEAIEFMMFTIEKFKLYTFDVDERFEILFFHILIYYSLSQLFNFIYMTIRNIAAYKNKEVGKYIPMANFIYKGISDTYEKAKLNKWTIINFNRPRELPQTELSKIISNDMLVIGESSFYEVITTELLWK